ncbi:hypothetical protein B0H63DRAFT_524634 [Podospora didyma]|uniref:Uncharacterized protein n=1 Tax=Podospora didyma TaxID=330526 RepID=A0AAE0TW96_9PEZI|nr:hypothetical protein B0H63DRAFT_524634 [Podospora didyma]
MKHLLTSMMLAGASSAASIQSRDEPATLVGQKFNLYAWGNGIPGLPVFYADGAAVFADLETAKSTDNLVPISFTTLPRLTLEPNPSSPPWSGYTFSASPNTTLTPGFNNSATQSLPFTTAKFYVPQRGSPPTQNTAGFIPDNTHTPSSSSLATVHSDSVYRIGGFWIGSREFRVVEDSGRVHPTLYCAFPSATTPGVWVLKWNTTNQTPETKDGVPVSLRTNPFPKGTKVPSQESKKCLIME